MLSPFDYDYPRESVYLEPEEDTTCLDCGLYFTNCDCDDMELPASFEQDEFIGEEYDHNDQYDMDSGLESVYGPSDEGQYEY